MAESRAYVDLGDFEPEPAASAALASAPASGSAGQRRTPDNLVPLGFKPPSIDTTGFSKEVYGYRLTTSRNILDATGKVSSVDTLVKEFNQEYGKNWGGKLTGFVLNALSCGLRVPNKMKLIRDGQVGVASVKGRPKLLKSGRYYFTSINENFDRTFVIGDSSIENIHSRTILNVKDGQLGCAYNEHGEYVVFETGMYVLNNEKYHKITVHDIVNQNNWSIKTGTLLFISIDDNKMAGIYDKNGTYHLIKPGKYVFDEKEFKDCSITDINPDNCVQLGPYQYIVIQEMYQGIVDAHGEIKVLPTGVFILPPTYKYVRQVSMKHRIFDLTAIQIITNDGIQVQIKGTLQYYVCDAKKAAINVKDFDKAIREQAEVWLSKACRSYSREDLCPTNDYEEYSTIETSNSMVSPAGASTSTSSQTTSIKERVQRLNKEIRDSFMVHSQVIAENWGIAVTDLEIESIQILDDHIKTHMSSIARSRIEAKAAKAKAQVKETEAIAALKTKKLATDGQAYELERTAKARAEAMIIAARARKEVAKLDNEGGELMKNPLAQQIALGKIMVDQLGATKTRVIPDSLLNKGLMKLVLNDA